MEKETQEAKLSYQTRKELPDSAFVFPKQRRYPIHDRAHARNALARVSAFGTPSEKAAVRRAVCAKYPDFPICQRKGKKEERALCELLEEDFPRVKE